MPPLTTSPDGKEVIEGCFCVSVLLFLGIPLTSSLRENGTSWKGNVCMAHHQKVERKSIGIGNNRGVFHHGKVEINTDILWNGIATALLFYPSAVFQF